MLTNQEQYTLQFKFKICILKSLFVHFLLLSSNTSNSVYFIIALLHMQDVLCMYVSYICIQICGSDTNQTDDAI